MGYFLPMSLEEAVQILAENDVSIVSGGTDFYPALADEQPKGPLLDLTRIASLKGITRTEKGWRFGAAVSWSEVARADLPASFNGLKTAARNVGALQIQNAGTIGGNLCNASPAADGVPPLLTLDAEVELTSSRGSRLLPLSDFITGVRRTALGKDEILTAVHIPAPPEEAVGSFLKLGSRSHLVISIAMVSALLWKDDANRVAGARIAVGACSPVAQRLPALEAALIGQPVDLLTRFDVSKAHLAPLSPISDMRASAEYRMDSAAILCRRAFVLAASGEDALDG